VQFGAKSNARNTTTCSSCMLRCLCAAAVIAVLGKGVVLLVAERCCCEPNVTAVGVAALQFCVLTLQCFVADDVVCEKLHTTSLPDVKVKEVNLQSSENVLGTLATVLIGSQSSVVQLKLYHWLHATHQLCRVSKQTNNYHRLSKGWKELPEEELH